jgi:hypothetical protein
MHTSRYAIRSGTHVSRMPWTTKLMLVGLALLGTSFSGCGTSHADNQDLPPAQPALHVRCPHITAPISIDGDVDKPAWTAIAWSSPFVDIEGWLKPAPPLNTRVKMQWDDHYLYIAARLEEPHVWATLTQRDSVIYHDNDFEVFLNPSCDARNYYELEINALNTVWDLLLRKPYREGGSGDNSFDFIGMKSAVVIHGTLNNPTDRDRGWDVEIALPWTSFTAHTAQPRAPRPGESWKINFSRVEWDIELNNGNYQKVPNHPEHNWVWSPMGMIDMHLPQRWGNVDFE